MWEELRNELRALSPRLVSWRRALHRHPEVGGEEKWTSAFLRGHFERLGIPVKKIAGTGLRAVLKGRPGGRTVALRADLDALPLHEEGAKSYKSLNPEAAHACGHDGHMAALIGAAELLARRKGQITGNVVFLCQPAEERPPGGAKPMIEAGALDGVEAIFGFHFWQPLPTGMLGVVKGTMMAQSDNFRIIIKGKGGHGSMPHQAVDPILAASHVVVNLQSIISRNVDPLKPAVISFGAVHGGTVPNIIPSAVELTGTARTLDPKVQALIRKRIAEIVEGTCRTFGSSAEFNYEDGYPPLVNDGPSVDFVLDVARRVLGEESIVAFAPVMGGEDFAYYLQEIPGAFFFLGAGDGMTHPHHHPAFDLDERALAPAAFLMTALAMEYLA